MKKATSRDETALDHQPDPEEPLQLHGSEVQSSESTESDILEDILPQLLELGTSDTAPAEEEEPRPKRQRLEANRCAEPVFNIIMLAVNGLMETLQKVNSQMVIREKTYGKTGKALTESISEIGKVASA